MSTPFIEFNTNIATQTPVAVNLGSGQATATAQLVQGNESSQWVEQELDAVNHSAFFTIF
jgi:hypothetical protein